MIKQINSDSVRQICSGQVVVDLATAVKELVENSLDAGATTINIQLKEMGGESISVIDNGCGIAIEDYKTVAVKHCTSKLSSFEDLQSVQSLGFRGEALGALCEISSSFTICTRTTDEEIGNHLSFNRSGELGTVTPQARGVGTTVTVLNLFANIPVRRQEFLNSIKKQYQKMLNILQSYAIISVGVKINVSNTTKSGQQSVMNTQLSSSILDNISSIWGAKFAKSLVPIAFQFNDISDDLMELSDVMLDDQARNLLRKVKVSGYVSKLGEGIGRLDNDKQLVYCNKRPVDLPRCVRAINEVWRQYDMKQKPACVLNIECPGSMVDVNLTPDKREIILLYEKCITDRLRTALDAIYMPSKYTFAVQDLSQFVSIEKPVDMRISPSLPIDPVKEPYQVPITHKIDRDRIDKRIDTPNESFVPIVQHIERKRFIMTDWIAESQNLGSSSSVMDGLIGSSVFEAITKESRKRKLVHTEGNVGVGGDVFGLVANSEKTALSFRVLSKSDFLNIEVLGQFNLGFIIGRLKRDAGSASESDDLFIFDQHACDEKFNFEMLMQNTVIHSQPMLIPLRLDLSSAEREIIVNHIEIFEANGFRIRVESDAHGEHSLFLEALPFSKSIVFSVDDIRELASLISVSNIKASEEPSEELPSKIFHYNKNNPAVQKQERSIILPKLYDVFASRACRSSIMIGESLSREKMKEIIDHLSSIHQPWNCPHGRPSLRHLFDMKCL